ncbi:MAG: DUF1651 domain-containing protein [Prochlorococcaceae cyanobacterium]
MAITSPAAVRAGRTTWCARRAGRRRWPEQAMHVGNDSKRPPLSPQEGWISDGRQVLHFRPLRYDRWSQALEVTFGELLPNQPAPLLKRRKELQREAAIELWSKKQKEGWKPCPPQWQPPQRPQKREQPPWP